MNMKEALKRIEELERRVKELEAQPKQEIHYHNYPALPHYVPPSYPWYPQPVLPWWNTQPTCGDGLPLVTS